MQLLSSRDSMNSIKSIDLWRLICCKRNEGSRSKFRTSSHPSMSSSWVRTKRDSKEEMVTNYMLSDQVFCDARVAPTDKICLWLGANVMLEYSLEEANELLSKNLDTATKNLSQIDVDLDYLRDQITTTEVNMARVYNWDVKRRQLEKQQS